MKQQNIKSKKTHNKSKKQHNKSNKQQKSCPKHMTTIKIKKDTLCIGRCPHSGGLIYYNPTLDKLVCKLHGSQFDKKGKVLTPPALSNLLVHKAK